MDAGGLREGLARVEAHTKTHKLLAISTPRSTQVRGPRVEVTPLLLPLTLCIITASRVTKVLQELLAESRGYPFPLLSLQ